MEGIRSRHAGVEVIVALFDLALAAGRGAWKVLAGLIEAHRREQARRELARLSDRMLKDIGLTRAEINGLFR